MDALPSSAPASSGERWPPLESSPDVFNQLMWSLGVPVDEAEFHDVYGLDDDTLEMVPQSVLAVIFCFPDPPQDASNPSEQVLATEEKKAWDEVYFIKQIESLGNACGTIALLHAVGNAYSEISLLENSCLDMFFKSTASMDPYERAIFLEKDDDMARAHSLASSAGDTELCDIVEEHYICFMALNGTLYELDGMKHGPTKRGSSSLKSLLQVINHGVSQSVMKNALEAASEFFELSTEHKEEFASDDIRQPIRYDTSSRDGISMVRSFLKHYANPLDDWIQFWPMQPPTYRKKMGEYAVEIQRVSMQLMGAIVQGLGLGPLYLQEKLEEGVQFMALNNYPQSSQAGDKVGLAPHSDYGFITILLQSSPGLEVMHHEDDAWMPIPAIPGALHVHIGDHLEVLSNGRLMSLIHRAILNPNEARISIASIHGLSMDEKVDCAEQLVDEHHPKMYRGSSFQDFLDFLPTNIHKYKRFVESLRIDRA